MKRIGLFILIAVFIAGIFIYSFRKKIISRFIPTVEQIGDITIVVNNDTAIISSKLAIQNNSFLKIEIDTLKYKLSLFDKKYLQNKQFIGSVLKGHKTDTIDFSLKIPYLTIIKDLKTELKKDDSTSYTINISVQYSTAFSKAEFTVNKSAKLKIPQPPEIEIVDIKYTKIKLKSIQADAKIKIVNYSDVSLDVKKMSYSMNIIKQGNLKGSYNEPIHIKPNETTYLSIPIKINVDNIGKTLFDVLMNRDTYDYTLTLNGILESSDPVKKSFQIDVSKRGEMELVK